MAKRRRKRKSSGRTISPEQQAKMQEGRRKAAVHKKRMQELYSSGVAKADADPGKMERMLHSVRRNNKED